MPEIDTTNKFLMGMMGHKITFGRVVTVISFDDALLLAAYLVAMAEPYASHKFDEVLKAVQNA